MRSFVIIGCGTTPSATIIDLLNRVNQEIIRLQKLNQQNPSTELQQKIQQLETNIQTLTIDVDRTNIYQNHKPLNNVIEQWPVSTFFHCGLPGKDTVDNIVSGNYPERFENTNLEAIQSLEADSDASGGTPPNGYLAVRTNQIEIRNQITRIFQNILLSSQLINSEKGIQVILVASTFGGFSSGSYQWLQREILKVAQNLQITINFWCFLLVPGNNDSKDRTNNLAVTMGVFKEQVGIFSEQHFHRDRRLHNQVLVPVKSPIIQTFFISDTNTAPTPKQLSIPNYISMVGELLFSVVATPLGLRLAAAIPDFKVRARELNQVGENQFGASLGLSIIHFDRERLKNYAISKLSSQILSRLLIPQDEEQIKDSGKSFIQKHQLLQGSGFLQISRQLLEPSINDGLLTVARFSGLVQNNLSRHLTGDARLFNARIAVNLGLQQAGDLETALNWRSQQLINSVTNDLQLQIKTFLQNYQDGVVVAIQWLEIVGELLNHIHNKAGEDNTTYNNTIQKYQNSIEHIENNVIPKVRTWKHIQLQINKEKIEKAAQSYVSALKSYEVAKMRQAAHQKAISILQELAEITKFNLQKIQQMRDIVSTVQGLIESENNRIVAYEPHFECPNGLSLIKTQNHLDYYYNLMLNGDENRAIVEVSNRFLSRDNIEEIIASLEQLLSQIYEDTAPNFTQQIAQLHVVSELRRQFPQENILGSVLRSRDLESCEFFQLRTNVDIEQSPSVVRLVGIDQPRSGNVGDLLTRYGYRRTPEIINTGDPDKIVFLQYRGVFRLSEWAHFNDALDAYERVSTSTPFEKIHVVVGSRYLPVPGQYLTDIEAQLIVIKGWMLSRIHKNDTLDEWEFYTAGVKVPLNSMLSLLTNSQESYKYAVEIITQFNCFYIKHGPDKIRAAINYLSQVKARRVLAKDDRDAVSVYFLDESGINKLLQEVAWWEKNCVPQAMEWGRK